MQFGLHGESISPIQKMIQFGFDWQNDAERYTFSIGLLCGLPSVLNRDNFSSYKKQHCDIKLVQVVAQRLKQQVAHVSKKKYFLPTLQKSEVG